MVTNEELVTKSQNGCAESLHQLIKQNEGLVRTVARRYLNTGEREDDLQSICRIQLWECVDKFNLDRNKDFHQYAATAMENKLKQLFQYRRRQKRDAILEWLDEIMYNQKSEGYTLGDLIADPESEDGYTFVEEENWLCGIVEEYLRNATYVERGVLEARFIAGYPRQEVADFLQKSREYVRKVEVKVLDGLRNIIQKKEQQKWFDMPFYSRYKGEICYVYTS